MPRLTLWTVALMLCLVGAALTPRLLPSTDSIMAYRSFDTSNPRSQIYFADLRVGRTVRFVQSNLGIGELAWSPAGMRMAFLGFDPGVRKWRWLLVTDPFQVSHRFEIAGSNSRRPPIVWSPDGTRVAGIECDAACTLFVADLTSGALQRYPDYRWTGGAQTTWTEDGLFVAGLRFDADQDALFELDPATGALDLVWDYADSVAVLSMQPTARGLFLELDTAAWPPDLIVFDPASDERWSHTPESYAYLPAPSPDGSRVVYVLNNRSVVLADFRTGETRTLFERTSPMNVEQLVWSPDGAHVLLIARVSPRRGMPLSFIDVESGEITARPDLSRGDISWAAWSGVR